MLQNYFLYWSHDPSALSSGLEDEANEGMRLWFFFYCLFHIYLVNSFIFVMVRVCKFSSFSLLYVRAVCHWFVFTFLRYLPNLSGLKVHLLQRLLNQTANLMMEMKIYLTGKLFDWSLHLTPKRLVLLPDLSVLAIRKSNSGMI